MPTNLKTLMTLGLLPVIGFCLYGLLASFEPGVAVGWKIGYSVCLALSLAGGVLPWIGRRA